MTAKMLTVIAWLGVLVAVFAAATQHQTVMAIAGIVAALAAGAWGLVRTFTDKPDMTAYREQVWARRDAEQDEAELPYREPVRTENVYRMPVWPAEVGAPE